MNTKETEGVLRRARVKDFDGVFSADTLPSQPRLLVVNIDDSQKPGRHWVCMWVNDVPPTVLAHRLAWSYSLS